MRAFDFETAERPTPRREHGAINITLSIVLLCVLGTTVGVALESADRAMWGGQSYARHTAAILLAEAAIEDAMAELDTLEDWSAITLPVLNYTQPHTLGRGIIWSDLYNDASDEGGTMDANRAVLIRGYGRFMGSEPIKGVEALYWRPTLEVPPVAGVNICGSDILDSGNGNTTIDGFNHALPPSGCNGSSCNAVRNYVSPDVAGVALERADPALTNGEQDELLSLPRTVLGAPAVQYGACRLQGPDGVCDRTRFLMRNISRVVGLETLTTWPINGNGSYGSVSDPKLIRVAKGTTLKLKGNTQGAGAMVVEGTLEQVGTFTWTGVIIVGPGAILDMRGTANIFGSVVTAGSTNQPATLGIRGNGSISWAGDAVQIGPINMPGLVISWREFSIPEGAF